MGLDMGSSQEEIGDCKAVRNGQGRTAAARTGKVPKGTRRMRPDFPLRWFPGNKPDTASVNPTGAHQKDGHTKRKVKTMARKVTMISAPTSSNELIPLNDIPQDVKDLAEQIYDHVRKTGSRVRLEYDTVDEMRTEMRQLASYAGQRKAGILTFRVSPTRNLPETTKDVRITANVEANGNRNEGNDRKQPVAGK